MLKSNVRYIVPKDEAHRDRLVDEYEFLGYYVKVENGRVRVSSKPPPKVVPKKRSGRPRQ